MEILESTEDISQSHELAISIKNNKFAELVLNFLGKKEKIVYTESISYLLNHNDLEQFYYLLDAKLQKERNIVLDHFLVTISYNDSTRREISGIESLKQFQETRHVYPVSITLTWNLILDFPNSETIENQNIDLTFINVEDEKKSDEGKVLLTIAHTNQAWGIEVLNLFKDKIKNISVERPKQYKLLKLLKNVFSKDLLMPIILTILSMGSLVNSLYLHPKIESNAYYSIVKSDNIQNIEETKLAILALEKMNSADVDKVAKNLIKSDSLRENVIKINEMKSRSERFDELLPWLIGFVTVLFFVLAIYPDYGLNYYGYKSHILITKRAESNYKSEIDNKNKKTFYSVSFVVGTLILGLAVNVITIFIGI